MADDMLNGDACEACGEWLGLDAGYPMYCSSECANSRGAGKNQVAGYEEDDEHDPDDN